MTFSLKFLALVPVTLLTACGGGGSQTGGGTVPTPPPTPVATTPAATDAATLVAWTKDGGATAPFENGVERTTRTVTVNGVRHTAYVDSVAGYGDARVTYIDGTGATVFALVDNSNAAGPVPTGVYTGEIDAVWTPDADIGRQSGTGRIAITLDAAAGDAWIDSIIGGHGPDRAMTSNIEFMGGATVNGNTLVADDMTVRYRDGDGAFLHEESGVLDGRLIAGSDTSAIIGTITAESATAGFTTGFHPEYTAEWLAAQNAGR